MQKLPVPFYWNREYFFVKTKCSSVGGINSGPVFSNFVPGWYYFFTLDAHIIYVS